MAVDLSQLPDQSSGTIDLNGLPDKPEKVNLSGIPDKGGFSPSGAIIKGALDVMKTPWQRVQEGVTSGVKGAEDAVSSVAGSAPVQGALSAAEKDPLASTYVAEGKAVVGAAQTGFKAYSSALEGIQQKTTDTAIKHGIDPYIAHFAGMAASSVADLAAQATVMGGMGSLEDSMMARNLVKDNILQLDEKQAQDIASLASDSDPVAKQREIEDKRRQEELQYNLERNATPSDQLKGECEAGQYV